jgi:hypothetical protein
MFGLMKASTCSLADEFKLHRRLHYCGTCKTMGSLYGHKSRMLLNHDTVFLAEVLSAIADTDAGLKTWNRAYQSFNCLALPASGTAMPLALQIAATATVVLAQFKIADQITDSKGLLWNAARKMFSGDFREARARLKAWHFPFGELQQVLLSQESREARAAHSTQSADDILNDLAEPTAIATAMFCELGARLVGRPEAESRLYELGYNFGRLIYLLDAFEDYEKDRRKGDFNAIASAYRIAGFASQTATIQRQIIKEKMPDDVYREVTNKLRRLVGDLESTIYNLPMPDTYAQMFAGRLRSNLSGKIGALPVVHHSCKAQAHRCESKLSFAERIGRAVDFSNKMTTQFQSAHPTTFASRLAAPLVFASVLPVAFFNPQQATTATSYRQCLSLGFNLIFFGAAINTAGAIVNSFFFTAESPGGGTGAQLPPSPEWQPENPQAPEPPKPPDKKSSTCSDCGDVCCCCGTCCECITCCDT